MAAAPTPDEVLRSTTGKGNFQRIARLLISGGTSLLREIFDVNCPQSQLPRILSNSATKKRLKAAKLTKPQWDCLYPSPGVHGKSTNFDITLLFGLLRTICNLPPPATGWDALPTSADYSLTADLARIKYYRNSIYGHVNQTMEVTDDEFPSLWQDISEALIRIAGQISYEKKAEWQKAIKNFLKDPLTAEDERNVTELESWYENDIVVKKAIEDLKLSTQKGMGKIDHQCKKMRATFRNGFRDMKNQMTKIQRSMRRHSSSAAGDMAASTSAINDNVAEHGRQHEQTTISRANMAASTSAINDDDAEHGRQHVQTSISRANMATSSSVINDDDAEHGRQHKQTSISCANMTASTSPIIVGDAEHGRQHEQTSISRANMAASISAINDDDTEHGRQHVQTSVSRANMAASTSAINEDVAEHGRQHEQTTISCATKMSENGVLEIPCLGKPFQPGMLYDCRNERLVSNVTLWKTDVLKNALSSRPLQQSQYTIFTNNSLDEKMEMMGVKTNFKLSLLSGLAEVPNYANFVEDRSSSKQQTRVTLKHESISSFQQLDISLLKSGPQEDVNVQTNATHFVSGVQYGFNTFFVFDRKVERNERPVNVSSEMKLLVSFLPRISVNDMGLTEIPEVDMEEAKKLTCTLYDDKTHSKSNVSFQEAVKYFQELKKSRGNLVPIKVWLHPLSCVDIPGANCVYECNLDTVTQIQVVMENILDTKIRLNDLVKNKVCASFASIQKKVVKFIQMMSQYKKNLQKILSSLLSEVRSGNAGDADLKAMLQAIAATPFHQPYLSSWADEAEKEVKLLSMYLEYFKGIQFVSSPEELQSVINSLEYDKVVCFAFMVGDFQDKQLQNMYTYLHNDGAWNRDLPEEEHWYNKQDLTGPLKTLSRDFMDLVKASNDDEKVKYIVTDVSNAEKNDQAAVIQFFQDGSPTDLQLSKISTKPSSSSQLQGNGNLKSSPSVKLDDLPVRHQSPLSVSVPYASTGEVGSGSTNDQSMSDRKIDVRQKVLEIETKMARKDTSNDSETQTSSTCHSSIHKHLESEDRSGRGTALSKDPNTFEIKGEVKSHTSISREVGPEQTHEQTAISHTKETPVFPPSRRLAETAKDEEFKIEDNNEGNLSIYKLPMEEELTNPSKMIAKRYFGKPGEFLEKVLLVVGATGAGKSTLINGMVNYIMGVKWEDDFRFKVVIDDAEVSTTKSQTKYITAYTFYPMHGSALSYKFTIIDTPGFGDTEGLKRDKDITKQIKEFFSIPPPIGINHLDGIGFVTQASLARLTPTQEYIFASVLSIFGKDLSKNIFMMVTFADGQKPPVLKAIKDAKITNDDKHFKFNNSALFADNKEEEDSFDEMFWKMGFRSFAAFFNNFVKAESVTLELTKEVLNERDHLQTIIEGLNPQINMGLDKIEEMRQEETVLQQREAEIETNKKFTYTIKVNKPRKVDLSGKGIYTTTCIKCNFTCHNDCRYSNDDDKHQCSSMDSNGDCNVCPSHCHWNEHKNFPYVWEYEMVVETRTSEDLKRKYESAKEGKFKVKSMIEQLDGYLENVHTTVMCMIYKAQECLRRLDEIALKPNPLSNVDYLELLIESEKQTANPGWKQRIQYLEEAKRHAEMLSKVTEVDAAKQIIKKTTLSGDKWYSRFKFW